MDSNQELKELQEQEQQLEELRALVRVEHWPRIYELLREVRERIRVLEMQRTSDPDSRKAS